MRRNTYNGHPGITAEFFRRRDEVNGRPSRTLTDEQIQELIAEQVRAQVAEALAEREVTA